jgi:beta-lactamase regulating signal transducer with metallopeptidase domain
MAPLVDIAVRAAVVLAAGWTIAALLHRHAAATRHFVWTLAAIGALLLPVLMAAIPRVRVLPEALGPISTTSRMAEAGSPQVIAFVWAALSALLLLRLAFGYAAVRRLAAHAGGVDERWRALLAETAASMGVTRPIRLAVSDEVCSPMTWGTLRPVILIPAHACNWTDERARVVLLHELAHVRRADCVTHALARLLAALYWFNPLAWVAVRAIARERELACDDLVLLHDAPASEYAAHLLDIAQSAQAPGHLLAVAMARPSELEGRMLAILTPRIRRASPAATRALATAAACITLAVAAAASSGRAPAVTQTSPVAQTSPPDRRLAIADALLAAAEDESSQVREKAIMGLATVDDPRVIDVLLKATRDEDSQVREKAVLALGLSNVVGRH